MKTTSLSFDDLGKRLGSLAVFRPLLSSPGFREFLELWAGENYDDARERSIAAGSFAAEIYLAGGDLSRMVQDACFSCETAVTEMASRGKEVPAHIKARLEEELEILEDFSSITPGDLKAMLDLPDIPLAAWTNEVSDLKDSYLAMLAEIPAKGFGIFARYRSFKAEGGELLPVKNADTQTLDELYEYERERKLVYENTRALAEGRGASNVLLYGDAGTGKSSTVKACAYAFRDMGVRLIEFDKDELDDIPKIMEKVYDLPLKFIFYIDDLSFTTEDESFRHLKGLLEGSVAGKSDNIAIYATSNRRHLVRELAEDRQGTDLHLNDTLQQTMSLSARFGLTITFMKPDKKIYLEIVRNLAKEKGIEMPEEELAVKAEAFAIRSSGRSPRTAQQFIQLLSIGLI